MKFSHSLVGQNGFDGHPSHSLDSTPTCSRTLGISDSVPFYPAAVVWTGFVAFAPPEKSLCTGRKVGLSH